MKGVNFLLALLLSLTRHTSYSVEEGLLPKLLSHLKESLSVLGDDYQSSQPLPGASEPCGNWKQWSTDKERRLYNGVSLLR